MQQKRVKKCKFCGGFLIRKLGERASDFKVRKFCCQDHYWAWMNGSNHHNFKTGVRVHSGGYLRTSKDKYLHRIEVEKFLGRKLKSTEHVHHIDGNKVNNDIRNLMVVSNSEHRKLEVINQIRDKHGKFKNKN